MSKSRTVTDARPPPDLPKSIVSAISLRIGATGVINDRVVFTLFTRLWSCLLVKHLRVLRADHLGKPLGELPQRW